MVALFASGVPRRSGFEVNVLQAYLTPRVRRILGEWARFVGVGAVSYAFGAGISTGLHELVGLPTQAAVGISLSVLLITNFALNRIFVFRSGGAVRGGFLRFAGAALILRGGEYVLFLALLHFLPLHYLVAFTAALVISNGVKFLVYRNVVFNKPRAITVK